MKNYSVFTLITFLTLVSCKSQQNDFNVKDAKSIAILLYNYESSKIPPPSIEDLKNGLLEPVILQGKQIDSIKYVLVKDCIFETIDIELDEEIELFSTLLDTFNNNHSTCHVNEINLQDISGNKIPKVAAEFSNEALNKIKNQHNVLGVVSFSQIAINNEGNKAIVCFGATREGLDANWNVYFLQKKDGEWKIYTTRTLSIS